MIEWKQVKPPPQSGVSGEENVGIGKNGFMTFHSKFVRKYRLEHFKWINFYVDKPAKPTRIAFDFPDRPNELSYPFRKASYRSIYYRIVCLKAFITDYALDDIKGLHFKPIKDGDKFIIELFNPTITPRKAAIMKANRKED